MWEILWPDPSAPLFEELQKCNLIEYGYLSHHFSDEPLEVSALNCIGKYWRRSRYTVAELTHWGQDKMAEIFQTIFSMHFLGWKCISWTGAWSAVLRSTTFLTVINEYISTVICAVLLIMPAMIKVMARNLTDHKLCWRQWLSPPYDEDDG